MKQKNLQPIILYPGRLSFRFEEKSKAFPDKQNLRVQHRQTSFTTNTKGTSFGRKHKRRKRPTENKPKAIQKMVIGSSVQFSHSVMSNSLQLHELQHAGPPCPSPTPGDHSNSCPSSRWCHPAISSSVVPFSSCPQSLPASETFLMSQLFTSSDQSLGVSALGEI